jgi:cytidylate kinase
MDYGYVDTGAMYRGIAYAYAEKAPRDLERFLSEVCLTFSFDGATKVFLDGEEVSQALRTPEMSLLASSFSQDSRVRAHLVKMQREIGEEGGIVIEGRDMGSVVFPDAEVKFYLDAEAGERARRRYLELAAKGAGADLKTVKEEMEKRDRDDSERALAPLVCPQGAFRVDTTGKGVEEVVEILKSRVLSALRKKA